MERLTERDEYGNADIIGVDSMDLQGSLALAHYEDLDEQGRLHITPCKLGQMVYRFQRYFNDSTLKSEVKIKPCKIESIWTDSVMSEDHVLMSFSDFGKNVFLTRPEAEAALIRGNEKSAKPRFTPAEAETARQITQMFPSARNARLGSSGQGLIIETDGLEPLIPRQDLFPSLRPGERVPLSEIAEGAG